MIFRDLLINVHNSNASMRNLGRKENVKLVITNKYNEEVYLYHEDDFYKHSNFLNNINSMSIVNKIDNCYINIEGNIFRPINVTNVFICNDYVITIEEA